MSVWFVKKGFWKLAALAVLSCALLVACDNPFDPLEAGSGIEGLSYIDWAGEWDRWDSDPEYDGFVITMEYYNQYATALEFTDKPHTIKIEFYTQRIEGGTTDDEGVVTGGYTTYDQLVFTHTVTFRNTNDDIRIPRELYESALTAQGYDITADEVSDIYILVHVYPPGGSPQQELICGYPDQQVYVASTGATPN